MRVLAHRSSHVVQRSNAVVHCSNRGHGQGRVRGFTLLEMMIALGILAISLTWLVEASMRAVAAENHSKLVTTATFLARQQMVQLEDDLQQKGIGDDAFASEKVGDFEEDGFKRFKWKRVVDKITLPGTDTIQTAMGAAQNGSAPGGSGQPPGGGMMGMAGGGSANMFASQFGIVKDVLEQAIRRATVTIVWTENGAEKSLTVSQYLTDPRRVDQAIQIPGGAGGIPGLPGAGGGTNPNSQTIQQNPNGTTLRPPGAF